MYFCGSFSLLFLLSFIEFHLSQAKDTLAHHMEPLKPDLTFFSSIALSPGRVHIPNCNLKFPIAK